MGEGHRRYLEATESSMEVVEGQNAMVDCQKAKEPGGTDQQKEQKGAAKGPAVRIWEDTGGHTRVKQGLCRDTGGHTGMEEKKHLTQEHESLRKTLMRMGSHTKKSIQGTMRDHGEDSGVR